MNLIFLPHITTGLVSILESQIPSSINEDRVEHQFHGLGRISIRRRDEHI